MLAALVNKIGEDCSQARARLKHMNVKHERPSFPFGGFARSHARAERKKTAFSRGSFRLPQIELKIEFIGGLIIGARAGGLYPGGLMIGWGRGGF